ncbi:MAG: peptidase M16, partial [Desulfobacterales bacterium]
MTISCTPGNLFAGFILKEHRKNSEIDADIYLFEHQLLGCPLLAIKNSDSNKTFSAAFNTIPTDSTGVAHILEHSVLMGSEKYPVKDVFGEINKGGITTFLNAMTGADITYYPFATRNMKEYFDIMGVYCDVVFHPLLERQTFEQEGWHYHQEGENQPLQIQGVVYNEMKGAFSDPIRHLFHNIFKGLLPNSTYAHESGGDPLNIPDLSYEAFCAFHKKHYHPSNAIFFLYGDAPLEQELEFLQQNFLSHYKEKGEKVQIEEGNPICAPVSVEESYAVGSADTADKTFLAVGTNVGTILNRLEGMAFQVIANILYNSDASPLKNAIIASGVCKDFGGLYVASSSFRTMMITYLIGSEKEHKEAFLALYKKTLTALVEEGLDKELVLAELNKFEFGYREEGSKAQRGLSLIMRAMNGLKYGGDVMEWLESEEFISTLRRKALEEGWFEELIKKHLLDNPATVTVVLTPDSRKQQMQTDEEKKRLAAYDAAVSDAEKKQRILRTEELQKAQLTPNDEKTLALLPHLSIDDLPAKIDYHQVLPVDMFAGKIKPVLVSELPTNHITYLDAGFDVSTLTAAQLPLLDIFSTIACEIGTEKMNFQQFA